MDEQNLTNEELLAAWKEVDNQRRKLWQEICRRDRIKPGLILLSQGIDINKRDSAWRNPVILTKPAEVKEKKAGEKIPEFKLDIS